MRWDAVVEALMVEVRADPTLVAIYGDEMGAAGWTDQITPGLGYRVITDTEVETWEPIIIQWDQWATTTAQLVSGERALRNLFNKIGPTVIGGVYMWSVFTDGQELGAALGPDNRNYFGRAVRFQHQPLRESLMPGRSAN